jgi:hypothetical protein
VRESTSPNYTFLGMLAGAGLGSGLAVVLFAITGEAAAFVISAIATAIGLVAGAGVDQATDGRN